MKLTDLQRTLEQHASAVPDLPVGERLAAVHGRVRVVRRRRRAAVALAAVLAVVGVGVVAGLPGRDAPEPARRPTVGGHRAPETMTALGYGYRFSSAVTGDGRAVLHLTASDQPRLVSWAAARGDVVLDSGEAGLWDTRTPEQERAAGSPFGDFHLVSPDAAGRVTVTGRGPVALAVYDLVSLPAGVGDRTLFFRDDVAGQRRLAGDLAGPGRTSTEVSFVVPAGGYTLAGACAGVSEGYGYALQIPGRQTINGSCTLGGQIDAFGTRGDDTHAPVGRTLTARVWLTRGQTAQRVTSAPAGLRLGVAVYTAPPVAGRVGDLDVPGILEADGHTWRQTSRATAEPGATRYTATVSGRSRPLLVWFGGSRLPERSDLTAVVDGVGGGSTLSSGGASQTQVIPVPASGRTVIELRTTGSGPDGLIGLATYEPVD